MIDSLLPMTLSNNLPQATLLLRQLGFVLMIEAQRYLVCVVLGFIAWTWWRRRAGSIVRLQSKPIGRSQLARETLYSATSILVFALVSIVIMLASGKSHRFFYAHVADYGWPYFVLSLAIMMGIQDTYFYPAARKTSSFRAGI
jgi:hypothetical protein